MKEKQKNCLFYSNIKNENKTNSFIFRRFICFLLAIALVISSLNLYCFSPIFASKELLIESNYSDVDYSNVENLEELESLRTSDSKTFKKVNDSFEVVMYGEDIHFLENGQYKEIDNTLSFDGNYYKNTKNRFNLNLNKDASLFSNIEYRNNILEWKINSNTGKINGKMASQKLEFDNLLGKGTKLEYISTSNGVKEYIILDSYIEGFSFSYDLKTSLELKELDNRLLFFNGEEHIFTIKEYFMYDYLGNISYDINYNISKHSYNNYTIDVKPNNEFLKNATYPIVIDPEIMINNEEFIQGSILYKLFDPNSIYFPYHDYSDIYPKVDLYDKLIVNLAIPSDSSYPGMNLKNSNLLYAYLNMPTDGYVKPRTSGGSTGQATVYANEITDKTFPEIDGNTIYSTSFQSSQAYSTGSDFIHRFSFFNALANKSDEFGTNFNIVLELYVSGGYGSFVRYNPTNGSSYTIPSFVIGYSNEAGLHDYYTYESYIGSSNSTTYIAHNSGNLINVYNDYTNGSLLNISHIYNSNRSHVLGNFGRGQRLNFEESFSITPKGEILLLNGDGSEVLFKISPIQDTGATYTKYIATNGSGDYFYKDGYSYYLITDDGVKKVYSSNRISVIYPDKDHLSKSITITYLNDRIYRIIDTFGTKVELLYTTEDTLDKMSIIRKDETGIEFLVRENIYSYDSNGNLLRVLSEDKLNVTNSIVDDANFTYSTKNKLLSIKDDKTHGLKFYYDYANRISKLSSLIDGIVNPPYINYVYSSNGRKLTLVYPDGKQETYAFDKEFHTKTFTNSLGYSSFTEYYSFLPSNTNYNKRHKILKRSQPFQTGYNLINNHGFELPIDLYWNNSSVGGINKSTKDSLFGNTSLILENKTSGDIASVYQSVSVKKGKEYLLSGYIRNPKGGMGSYLDITSSNVNIISRSEAVVNKNEYVYYYIKFIPTQNTTINVSLVNKSIGEAAFDMISLNNTNLDTRYNYLQNASFEDGVTGWNIPTSDVINSVSAFPTSNFGNSIARVKGNIVSQTVNVSGNAGDGYIYGGFAYDLYQNYQAKFSLTFNYKDGSKGINEILFDANDLNLGYLVNKARAEKEYLSITFKVETVKTHSYFTINEYIYFDNLALYKEGYGIFIDYNDDGKVEESINDITGDSINIEYDVNKNIKTITENNIATGIEYYNNTDTVKKITTDNVSVNYSYDSKGNVISNKFESKDGTITSQHFLESTTYSPNGQFIKTKTNEYGHVSTYTFDYLTNLLCTVKLNSREVNYEYDALSNNTKTSQGNKEITYHYDGFLLTGITMGGLTYTFQYNEYHDLKKVLVAEDVILENTYNDINNSKYKGEVSKTKYGTDEVSFYYDEESRVKEVHVNGEIKNSYLYDSLSNIAEYTDHQTNITCYYNYDLENRLIKVTSTDGNHATYSYDEDGNLINSGNINGSTSYEYVSTIEQGESQLDDSKVISKEKYNNFRKEYNYQNRGLKKLENTAIITLSADITSTYEYDSIIKDDVTYDSIRIKSLYILSKDNSGTNGYIRINYEYDQYNNIYRIIYNDGGVSRTEGFLYDEFNQLVSHYDYYNGLVTNTSYSYDERGNITSIIKKDQYNNELSRITLSYKTSGWVDQLITAVIDGVTYNLNSYNSSGNPLNYLNYTVTYTKGNISSLVKGTNNYSYTYNAKGVRISKDVNGVITNFTLDGSKVITESKSGVTLKFYYDINEKLEGFTYNSQLYIYLKNIQNDIIGIANANGDILVKYFYDAYGNIIRIIDVSGINLANINPFRYRSYYYDNETGFYYLNSRFYNPLLGRFINADSISYLGATQDFASFNLYAYCGNNPVMGYDPMGTWDWGAFWKVAGGVALATVAVVAVVATGGTALVALGAGVAGYAIGSNVATVIESEVYVKKNNAEAMSKDEYIGVNEDGKTTGLSRENKLRYIRYIRGANPKIHDNWSEAQMLREFEYHDRVYNLSSKFLNIPDNKFPSKNTRFVDFEEKQNVKTFIFRLIGNMLP